MDGSILVAIGQMLPRRKRQRTSDNGEDGDAVSAALAKAAGDFHQAEPQDLDLELRPTPSKLPRSLFVHSLPPTTTTETLADHFSQSYPLKHATVVLDKDTKQSKGYGFVTFADGEDAQKARQEFDSSVFDGKKIRVDIAEPRHREIDEAASNGPKRSHPSTEAVQAKAERQKQRQEAQRPPKLIIRNLPWSIKDPEQLATLFRGYGKVKHATLPKQKPGLSPGFGFVVLRGKANAEKALIGVNGKVVDGRTLAVDWAVEKDVWQASQTKNRDEAKNGVHSKRLEEDTVMSQSSEEDGGIRLDGVSQSYVEGEHGDSRDESDDDHDINDLDEEGLTSDDGVDDHTQHQKDTSTTLFIRNLPFTATDEILIQHFKSFGPVRYARVVMDNNTGRSRGTGFVCFYNEDDARGCLRQAPRPENIIRGSSGRSGKSVTTQSLVEDTQTDPFGRFTIDGRVLQVTRAVDRDEAHRLTVEGTSAREVRDKDKRRLYLLSEGTIASDSPLYASLPPSEAKTREESAKQRQMLIRSNPSLHLSLTRLSVRNLPRDITSKDLKALAREAVVAFATDVKAGRRLQLSKEELSRGGEEMKIAEKQRKAKGKGIVKQAKIVFEGREGGKVSEDSGAGRSRGYGFVEYSSHRWALMGLRWLNGHRVQHRTGPKTVGNQGSESRSKRLIVEFSIENAQVVARRQDKEHKARERSKLVVENKTAAGQHKPLKKQLSKDSLMKRNRLGEKRKREETAQDKKPNTVHAKAESSSDAAKTQSIIRKKKMARKKGSSR